MTPQAAAGAPGAATATAQLATASWPELQDRDLLLCVPVGATEQHGPHLPLGTDTMLATALAEHIARQRVDVVVAPAVPYGSSGEHQSFPGTLSIGQRATELLLVELCRSASATFRRIILLSTHGGNAQPLRRAHVTLREEGRDVRVHLTDWRGDAHAGRTETSLMLAVAPGLVQSGRARAGDTRPLEHLIDELRARGVRALSPSGVLGDPADAGADEGRELFEAAADRLLAELEDWA